ncbi:unnamed protein product, partial [marine sediment metagenome]
MTTLKGSVADITCITTDIGDCAITSAKLGGSAAITSKIQDCAVTSAKMALGAGKWVTGTWSTAAGSACFIVTFTAACAVIQAIVMFSAAQSAGSLFDLEDSGAATILSSRECSVAVTHVGPQQNAQSGETVLILGAAA